MRSIFLSSAVCLLLLFSSCGRALPEGKDDLRQRSPELATWVEANQAEVLPPLRVESPSRFSTEDVRKVRKYIEGTPSYYSVAQASLVPPDDVTWRAAMVGAGGTSGKVAYFGDYDLAKTSKDDDVLAWPIVVERSNNTFGDCDVVLIIFTLAGKPIGYSQVIFNAGLIDKMSRVGIYIPPDRISSLASSAKTLGELTISNTR